MDSFCDNVEVYRQRVRKYARTSRIIFIALSAFSNLLFTDHDSLDAFRAPGIENQSNGWLDDLVEFVGGGLLRWDAHHYLHIAQYGYTFENNLAFFPLYPVMLRVLCKIIDALLFGLINKTSVFVIASLSINVFVFIKASVCLFDLTMKLFNDPCFAYKTAVFYCISPATVFFIAPYSETVFSYCVFKGMLMYACNEKLYSTMWFCLSSGFRSNGIINFGFVAHYLFFQFIEAMRSNRNIPLKGLIFFIKIVVSLLLVFTVISAPYFLFQVYTYHVFCYPNTTHVPTLLLNYSIDSNLILPINGTEWCSYSLPISYFYVQSKYWNVGFLKYYSIQQIPNFFLMLPVIVIILKDSVPFILQNRTLLFNPKPAYKYGFRKSTHKISVLPKFTFVYVIHAIFLITFCVSCINVQVTTRILASSSPIIYWIASLKFSKRLKHYHKIRNAHNLFHFFPFSENPEIKTGHNIRFFFISYAFTGIVLFSNNLPWT